MQMSSKNITIVAGVVAMLLLGWTGAVRATIAIKPSFVEVDIQGKRPTGVFYVTNLSDKEARFRVNAVHFSYTEDGGLQMAPTGENSIAPWIRFNPRELTLAPKSQRAVRFAIVPRGPVDQGEHWAGMELESLDVGEAISGDPNSGHAIKVRSSVSLLAPIFATAGQTTYQGEISDMKIGIERGVPVLQTMVAATGTGRLGLVGTFEILDGTGKTVQTGSMGACYVFRGARRWVKQKVENVPEGQYTVRVTFKAAHLDKPLTIERQLAWPSQSAVAASAKATAAENLDGHSGNSTDGNEQTKAHGSVTESGT